jgi:hypothetical protein
VIKISTGKSKNNPNNRQVKQIKPKESSDCKKYCSDVGECKKYKKYIERLNRHRICYGINCNKVINEY